MKLLCCNFQKSINIYRIEESFAIAHVTIFKLHLQYYLIYDIYFSFKKLKYIHIFRYFEKCFVEFPLIFYLVSLPFQNAPCACHINYNSHLLVLVWFTHSLIIYCAWNVVYTNKKVRRNIFYIL